MSNKSIVAQLIKDNAGDKFFSVTFKKKDNTLRKMNCRFGVHVDSKGGQPTSFHHSNLLTVRDVKKKAYRTINVDTITELKIRGKKYQF